jgi:soluble lytic murein transglycosylase-like protein
MSQGKHWHRYVPALTLVGGGAKARENAPYRTGLSVPASVVAFVALGLMAALAHAEITPEQLAQFAALRTEARAYEFGEGVPKDPVRAQETYCKAARMGDAQAQYRLGWMYTFGRGILARDDGLAAFFYGLAADQGHEQARNMLRLLGKPEAYSPDCMRDPVVENFEAEPPVFENRQEPFAATTPEQSRIVKLVERIAPDYGVSPRLALAVIRAESNFNPMARSPRNAQGLMQLIPETSIRFNVKNPYDPVQNVRGGLSYLRWLLAYFEGNVALVAAAYNSGEQTVNRYRGVPPYAETRAYVKQVRQIFRRNDHPYDARVTEPSPELPRIRPANMH